MRGDEKCHHQNGQCFNKSFKFSLSSVKEKKMKSLISAHPIRWSVLGVGSISSSVHDQSADLTQSAGRARCTFDETLVIEDFEMTFYDIELDLRLSV